MAMEKKDTENKRKSKALILGLFSFFLEIFPRSLLLLSSYSSRSSSVSSSSSSSTTTCLIAETVISGAVFESDKNKRL